MYVSLKCSQNLRVFPDDYSHCHYANKNRTLFSNGPSVTSVYHSFPDTHGQILQQL